MYDPTKQHAKTINDTIDMFKANQKLSEKIADALQSLNPKTPTLKLPPKVHKENHPGRPIVSSINSHSTTLFTTLYKRHQILHQRLPQPS